MEFSIELNERLGATRSLCALTGAGISEESGIPTFRGLGGVWRTFRPEQRVLRHPERGGALATPEAFRRDPALVWEWYEYRRTIKENHFGNMIKHTSFGTLTSRPLLLDGTP